MNDITIKTKVIKRELWILLGLFLFAFILNIFSIVHYKTSWSELFTQLHVVILISIFLYCVVLVIRLLVDFIAKMFNKKVPTK